MWQHASSSARTRGPGLPAWLGRLPALALLLLQAHCGPTVGPSTSTANERVPSPPAPASRVNVVDAVSSADPDSVVIVAGGDVSLGRETGQAILSDPDYEPFRAIAPVWKQADLRFVNLESQLSEQGGETQSPKNRLIFCGPPGGARVLSRAGVNVVSLANNHAWDYGRPAFFETLQYLEAASVRHVGVGRHIAEAYAPQVFHIKGKTIAWFAVTHVWNYGPMKDHAGRRHVAWASLPALRPALVRARAEHDVVLVSYHGGAEYEPVPSGSTQRFVTAVMKLGVDAVLGHHPHVIQGIGWVEGRPAVYSLGNLVFGPRPKHPWTRFGMLAKLAIGPGSTRSLRVCPYRIEGQVPVPLSAQSEERAAFLQHLQQTSSGLGGSVLGDEDEQGCTRVLPPAARSAEPLKPSLVAYTPAL